MPYSIVDAMSSILNAASTCLEETPLGVPGSVYVYHTSPPDDCGDILVAWIEDIAPTVNFPQPFNGDIGCAPVLMMATIKMRLVRKCWPVVKDNPSSPFPSAEEMNEAALKLAGDSEALWCCLIDGVRSGSFWIGAATDPEFILESIKPTRPRGGVVGIDVTMKVELG